jgi:wobble nucleotide-excising tRNase
LITLLQLLRNVGQFDTVNAGAQLPFTKLTLVYAENARGKTTLAEILRSLGTGDPTLIAERQRLGSPHTPHVVVDVGAARPHVFQNGTWSAALPQVAVFDDNFVAANVCSGLEVGADHRQNLHELILGAQGVALNTALQTYVDRIEEHNRALREKERAIPPAARGALSVDAFCALELRDDIDPAIQDAERALAAASSAEQVRQQPEFVAFGLPTFDLPVIDAILQRGLPELDAPAARRVQAHLAGLGEGSEVWVGEGMPRIQGNACPFCAQDLSDSPVIAHYRAYFSEGYERLKAAIAARISNINADHAGDVPAAFERAVRVATQRKDFWQPFTPIPAFEVDTAVVVRAWNAAREAVLAALRVKQAAPLDPSALPAESRAAISAYDEARNRVIASSDSLLAVNSAIRLVKEQAAAANVAVLTSDLNRLKAIRDRFTRAIAGHCQIYLDEKAAKAATEALRDAARAVLDRYRQVIFPSYEAAINRYLGKLNANFRLDSVTSINNRGGSTCTYSVVINNIPVALGGAAPAAPSFRNTLSAGDRNTLALAFFFASLEQDAQLGQKIVVIDDPMTSLDEHRSLATIQELRLLLGRVDQIIVLSHSKPFLCEIWEGADTALRSAIKITRAATGSSLAIWDVRLDAISENDKRHRKVAAYMQNSAAANEREVAAALRPMLESFMRVAYPATFPPGTLLGPFIGLCQQWVGTANQILNAADISELRALLDYANKFHHDTNAAWETEAINDQQLLQFCDRTLRFARRN